MFSNPIIADKIRKQSLPKEIKQRLLPELKQEFLSTEINFCFGYRNRNEFD